MSGTITLLGGSGSGNSFEVTFISEPSSILEDIVSPQPNDRALVLVDEIHNNESWWWIMADYNGDGIYNWVPLAPNSVIARDFFTQPIIANEL
jgi:hypothetical protein